MLPSLFQKNGRCSNRVKSLIALNKSNNSCKMVRFCHGTTFFIKLHHSSYNVDKPIAITTLQSSKFLQYFAKLNFNVYLRKTVYFAWKTTFIENVHDTTKDRILIFPVRNTILKIRGILFELMETKIQYSKNQYNHTMQYQFFYRVKLELLKETLSWNTKDHIQINKK